MSSPAVPSPARLVLSRGTTRFEDVGTPPPQPDWEILSSRVVCVLGKNPSQFTLNGTNCYLVGSGPRRLLIDTGEELKGSDEFMENLARCFDEQGIQGLSGVAVTHMHHDHFGGISRIQAQYGPLPVYTHRILDESRFSLLRGLRQKGLEHLFLNGEGLPAYMPPLGTSPAEQGVPSLPPGVDFAWALPLVRIWGRGDPNGLIRGTFYFEWNAARLLECLRTGAYDWRPLSDGDSIEVDGAHLAVMFSPGHAVDHISFLLEEEHALFSGDTVLGWGTTFVSDMRDYMATLRRMLACKPSRLYPGHGPVIEDGVQLLERYIDHRTQREEQAWAALQRREQPVQIADIVRELYPDTRKESLWMAKGNIEKLFRKFASDGAVACWRSVEGPNGARRFVLYDLPENMYSVPMLPRGLFWGARRSMVRRRDLELPMRRARL